MRRRIGKALLILFCVAVFFFKIEEIADVITGVKIQIFSLFKHEEEIVLVDLSGYDPFVNDKDAWYMNNKLIAHACGGIDGKEYTNSKEALEYSIQTGHKVIEVDFSYTSDNEVVCFHSYDRATDKKAFMNTPIEYLYTPMDYTDIFQCMKDNPDIYIMTDMKCGNEIDTGLIQTLVDYAKSAGYEECLQRLIIQSYYPDDIEKIKSIYPFKNIQYTLYTYGDRNLNSVANYCLANDLHSVTMPMGYISSADDLKDFREKNIKVFVHTTNDLGEVIQYSEYGVSGFYTDFLKPSDLDVIGLN